MRRTLPDWLAHAGEATDATEVARRLDAAVGEARSCHDWRTLLRGVAAMSLASRERVVEVAQRTLEVAVSERDVWGFRDVATARATRLDDVAAARAALEAGATALRKPRTDLLGRPELARPYEWVLLGQGFIETLQDRDGMRRCLEAGRDVARAEGSGEGLCDIAPAWAEHVDRNTAAALLLEAEGMATPPWTVANAWRSLGAHAAVRRVLDAALKKATSTGAGLHVAQAWASHREPVHVRRALTRARKLATTAHDWLAIGQSAHDAGLEEAFVRAAVGKAEALAIHDEDKVRVSIAYGRWLHDAVAAARVGPRGLRPEALRKRVRELEGWETSASGLFDWLRARATPEQLTRIANADYGTDADEHLAALLDVCETGLIPKMLEWEPHEVLALTRWSTGEDVDHVARALCCAILCIAPDNMNDLVTNGPILAESCLALGAEATRLVELFFAWRSETEERDEDVGTEQPVALLLLFLVRTASAPEDPRLDALAQRLTEHATYPLEEVAEWIAGSMRADLWTDLVDRVLVPASAAHPPVARVLCGLGR